MKKILYTLTSFLAVILLLGSCSKDNLPVIAADKLDPIPVEKSNSMQLWMHYMPWFETKETNDGKWGMHWTMADMKPDVIVDGKHQIASHYYPLIGPYASSDVDVIRYHMLLMKYSGVDGILIDWYGTQNENDYASNNKNTEVIVKILTEVGLKFAIVYEDQTLKTVADEKMVSQAVTDLQYLKSKFFSLSSYIKIDGKPLLMVFGPQALNEPAQWNDVFSITETAANFVTLYGHSNMVNNSEYKNAGGEFIWVDATDMDTKYATKDNFDLFIGGAYTGFKDFYKEGGWADAPLLSIDHAGGALFASLLQKAKANNMDYLQLITWNDFGEGTMIEPTVEFGYTFLTELQSFSKVSYTQDILETILDWYNLKKATKKVEESIKLDQAYYYLVALKLNEAKALMNEIKNN